jgi:glutamine synthetase
MATPTGRGEIIQKIATTEHKLNRVDFKELHFKDAFGANVFNEAVQRERSLDPTVADAVASAMKDWAIEKGATHYTHSSSR